MVKSKKMSKTSIAVIVLALLLVLSMVLGLTGAWYTAQNSQAGGSHTLVLRNSFIEFGATSNAAFSVTRDMDGDTNFGESDVAGEIVAGEGSGAAKTYTVLPGDHVSASGAVTFSVTNTGNVPFYYAIYKDGVRVGNAATKVANGDSIVVSEINDLDNKDIDADGAGEGTTTIKGLTGSFVVNTALTTASMGQTVAVFDIADYSIYAIQAENVTPALALQELDALAGYTPA